MRALLDVAQVVEANHNVSSAKGTRASRLKCFDIGGGLSVNYLGDSVTPSFEDYAQALHLSCPELFVRANLGNTSNDSSQR